MTRGSRKADTETTVNPPQTDGDTETVNSPPEQPGNPDPRPGADADEFGGDAPQPAEPTPYVEVKPQADGASQAEAEAVGYHGALAEPADGDPNAVLTADKAAPDGADETVAYFGMLPDTKAGTASVPLTELPEQPANLRETEDQWVGYIGQPPTSNEEREAMTLTAQAAKAREQYGDGEHTRS